MDVDLNSIQKKISAVAKENEKLQDLKKDLPEVAKKLSQAVEIIRECMNDIDPMLRLGKTSGGKHVVNDYTELVSDLYEKMKAGTNVTTQLVRNMKPSFKTHHVMKVMKLIEKMPHVEKTKDGINIRYFYHVRGGGSLED